LLVGSLKNNRAQKQAGSENEECDDSACEQACKKRESGHDDSEDGCCGLACEEAQKSRGDKGAEVQAGSNHTATPPAENFPEEKQSSQVEDRVLPEGRGEIGTHRLT
jgi:hypothetical protein